MLQLGPILGQITKLVGDLVLEVAAQLGPVLDMLATAFIQIIKALMPLLPPIADLIRSLPPAVHRAAESHHPGDRPGGAGPRTGCGRARA
jgi:hypothetical protein